MLLELTQSDVARRGLAVASQSIVELVRSLAAPNADLTTVLATWPHRNAPTKASLRAVLGLPVAQRQALRDAVEADLAFDQRFGQPGSSFEFASLDPSTRTAGKALLRSIYRDVFRDGHGFEFGNGEYANRVTWEDGFREANPTVGICPACLVADLPPRLEGRTRVDADHYLPNETYPPLGVHGLNLVLLCKPCNQSIKRNKDPLANNGHVCDLTDVWFPYVRAGLDEVDFAFSVSNDGVEVSFTGSEEALARAHRFDVVFSLLENWSRVATGIQQQVPVDLDKLKARDDPASVRAGLATLGSLAEGRERNNPRAFLERKLFSWLSHDDQAIAALVKQRGW